MSMDLVTDFFSTKTIEEVKKIKIKTRNDIERKKEDLRQMVGERYRDLIEAADTISCMQTSAENTSSYIKKIQSFYAQNKIFQNSFNSNPKIEKERQEFKKYIEIAAETKVLTDMPEKIWCCVEVGNMTNASFLYLQSLTIIKNLSLDRGSPYSAILQWFPMLGQQAQAVMNLRASIVKKSHEKLEDFKAVSETVADALCSIVLLEDMSLHQVLHNFLETRKLILKSILNGEGNEYKSAGSKTLISSSINCLIQTTVHVFELFCGGQDSYISKQLTDYVSRSGCPDHLLESTEMWSNYLPIDTTSQLIRIKTTDRQVETSELQVTCLSWLNECQQLLTDGVSGLLDFVSSTKDLSLVRSAAMDILVQAEGPEVTDSELDDVSSDVIKTRWSVCCEAVFGCGMDLWGVTLSTLFTHKMQILITRGFQQLHDDVIAFVRDRSVTEDFDLSNYLWREHDDDVTPEMAWQQWQQRRSQRPLLDGGNLTLKTLSVTPQIRDICARVTRVVAQLFDDVTAYLSSATPDEKGAVHRDLQQACFDFLARFNDVINEEIKCKDQILSHLLQIFFFTNNFLSLCPHLRRCCLATGDESRRRQLNDEDQLATITRWQQMVASIQMTSQQVMTVWVEQLLGDFVADFQRDLITSARDLGFLKTFASWTSINIDEEAEDGTVVTSQVHLPTTVSLPTHQLLFQVSDHLQRSASHSIGQLAMRRASSRLLETAVNAFDTVRDVMTSSDTQTSQTWAIQAIFDLRYLHQLLDPSRKNQSEEVLRVTSWIEGLIDPFDLDVFTPHLNTNIERHVARTSCLFGLVAMPTSRSSIAMTQSLDRVQNILPLIPDCGRFGALPISAPLQKSRSKTTTRQRTISEALRGLTESSSVTPDVRDQSSSTLYSKLEGAFSSSWLSMSSTFNDE